MNGNYWHLQIGAEAHSSSMKCQKQYQEEEREHSAHPSLSILPLETEETCHEVGRTGPTFLCCAALGFLLRNNTMICKSESIVKAVQSVLVLVWSLQHTGNVVRGMQLMMSELHVLLCGNDLALLIV